MTIAGLNASAVTGDDTAAIKVGVAAVMDGVDASNVMGVTVADASSRRLAPSSRALLGTAATVSFTVSVSLDETGFYSVYHLLGTVNSTLSSAESNRCVVDLIY